MQGGGDPYRLLALLALVPAFAASAQAGTASGGDGRPKVRIEMPPGYVQELLPVGTKTFRLQTDLPPDGIESIAWTLDGIKVDSRGDSATLSFASPDSHVIEACARTRDANFCDRQRLGPPPEVVNTRNRLIVAWVARKGQPDRAVSGLGRDGFGLAYRGTALESRILAVHENSVRSNVGVCLAYLFDVSGSTIGTEAQSGKGRVLVRKEDGSHELAPEVRVRFEAFTDVMRGLYGPPIANPDNDMILGGLFAGGLLTIGPARASRSESLPGRLEKLLVQEYLKDEKATSPLWTHTALYENVALVATVLNNDPACAGRKKAIAVDSDLVQFPDKAAVDLNDPTLEMIGGNYDLNDSSWLLEKLASEEIVSMPVYAIDRKVKPYTPAQEKKRQEFIRDDVEQSGGDTYYLAARSPEEIREKLQGFFRHVLGHTSTSYDVFWDPEGIDEPERVTLTHEDPELDVTFHRVRSRVPEPSLPRKVLADRSGIYNNAQKLAAAMLVRKSVEEGRGAPVSRTAIRSALEAEKRSSRPSGRLVQELERALFSAIAEELKYGHDPAAIRGAVQDLGGLESLPEPEVLGIADYIPSAFRDLICGTRSARGKVLEILKASVCSPQAGRLLPAPAADPGGQRSAP